MPIQRIHHVAYRCHDAKATVHWYQEHLGMSFVLAIAAAPPPIHATCRLQLRMLRPTRSKQPPPIATLLFLSWSRSLSHLPQRRLAERNNTLPKRYAFGG